MRERERGEHLRVAELEARSTQLAALLDERREDIEALERQLTELRSSSRERTDNLQNTITANELRAQEYEAKLAETTSAKAELQAEAERLQREMDKLVRKFATNLTIFVHSSRAKSFICKAPQPTEPLVCQLLFCWLGTIQWPENSLT